MLLAEYPYKTNYIFICLHCTRKINPYLLFNFAGVTSEFNGINISISPPLVTTQQQHQQQQQLNFGSSIFVRRPSPLLKSPSFDSESSDPPNHSYSVPCYGGDNFPVSRTIPTSAQRQGGMCQLGTASTSDRNSRRLFLASAFRYRTDSETTDDQCIPESLSEEPGHDSAHDTTEDIDEEDVEDEEDLNDASPNIDGPRVPQLQLSEAVHSSTESERTVVLDCQLTIAMQDTAKDSMDNISSLSLLTDHASLSFDSIHFDDQNLKSSMLSLPEIVILPGTPSASSPSAPSSPTHSVESSSSSVSIITATELVAKSVNSNAQNKPEFFGTAPTTSESTVCEVKSNKPSSNLPFNKAHSIPPHMSSMIPHSSLEYEQLDASITNNTSSNTATTSTAASCCSSRSESPLSDRGVIKCSSLVSLHLRNIEADGSSLVYPLCNTTSFTSDTALDTNISNVQVNEIYIVTKIWKV